MNFVCPVAFYEDFSDVVLWFLWYFAFSPCTLVFALPTGRWDAKSVSCNRVKWKELLTLLLRDRAVSIHQRGVTAGGDTETTSAQAVVGTEAVTILAWENDDLIINSMMDWYYFKRLLVAISWSCWYNVNIVSKILGSRRCCGSISFNDIHP